MRKKRNYGRVESRGIWIVSCRGTVSLCARAFTWLCRGRRPFPNRYDVDGVPNGACSTLRSLDCGLNRSALAYRCLMPVRAKAGATVWRICLCQAKSEVAQILSNPSGLESGSTVANVLPWQRAWQQTFAVIRQAVCVGTIGVTPTSRVCGVTLARLLRAGFVPRGIRSTTIAMMACGIRGRRSALPCFPGTKRGACTHFADRQVHSDTGHKSASRPKLTHSRGKRARRSSLGTTEVL